jgi:RNA polymerase sigma factor (sigma-70 family)
MEFHNPFPIPMQEVYKIVKKAVYTVFKGNPSKEQFDDLVQNSMVRLVEVFNYYDPRKGSFSNFVYMQVSWAIWRDNVHYNAKGRRRDFMIESLDYVIPNGDKNPTTIMDTIIDDSQAQQMEHDLSVQEVLQHFNERDRHYIQQIIINGEAVTKIAQQQNLTSSGVHSHLRRIKKKMKEVINENNLR